MRNITSQIKTYISLTEGKDFHMSIKSSGDKIISKLREIEENLYQVRLKLHKMKSTTQGNGLII